MYNGKSLQVCVKAGAKSIRTKRLNSPTWVSLLTIGSEFNLLVSALGDWL